jgi:hypothetical protein
MEARSGQHHQKIQSGTCGRLKINSKKKELTHSTRPVRMCAFNQEQPKQQTKKMIPVKSIDTLREATKNGCRFVGFLYQSKTGEVANYCINLGVDYTEAVQHDLNAVKAYDPADEIEQTAKDEIVASLEKTLQPKTIEEQKEDVYEHIGKGLKQHKEKGSLYIWGFQQSKTQVEPPTKEDKAKNSSNLTLAKEKIKKSCGFKTTKFRQYILGQEHIAGIVINGEPVEVQK